MADTENSGVIPGIFESLFDQTDDTVQVELTERPEVQVDQVDLRAGAERPEVKQVQEVITESDKSGNTDTFNSRKLDSIEVSELFVGTWNVCSQIWLNFGEIFIKIVCYIIGAPYNITFITKIFW